MPKDVLMDRTRLSTILRLNLRGFDLDCFSDELFSRNNGLRGTVGISHIKQYGKKDVTNYRESKNGWRLVRLDGSAEFLESLEAFPESKSFTLGSSVIQIRGGKRKQETRRDPNDRGGRARGRGGFAFRGRGRGRSFPGGNSGQGAGAQAP